MNFLYDVRVALIGLRLKCPKGRLMYYGLFLWFPFREALTPLPVRQGCVTRQSSRRRFWIDLPARVEMSTLTVDTNSKRLL
jgi:hypothetical protein